MAPLISFTSPSVGEWIIVNCFKKPVEAILYDPTSSDPDRANPPALKIWGWPYRQATPVLTFTEIIHGKSYDAADKEVISDRGPDAGKKKYKSIETLFGTDIMIGTRQERVNTIKFKEMHPAIVVATSKEKVNLRLVIMITVQVEDPIVALSFTNFLGTTNNLVVEVFRKWCAGKYYDEINRMDTSADNPHIPDEICIAIEKLNSDELMKYKVQVPHVALVLIAVAEDSAEVPESERKIITETNNVKVMERTKKIELLQNDVQEKKNATQIKLIQGKLEAEAKFITDTSQAIVNQNKAWGGESGLRTLIFNDPTKVNQQTQTIEVANATN